MRRKHSCPRIDAPRYCSRGRAVAGATIRSSVELIAVLIGSSERLARLRLSISLLDTPAFGRQNWIDLDIVTVVVIIVIPFVDVKLPTGATEELQDEARVGKLELPLIFERKLNLDALAVGDGCDS